MKFAKVVFLVAGIYGLIVLAPHYFLEAKTGPDFPPPITHPEFYYGFIGVTIAWQVLFLLLSKNPTRYRISTPGCRSSDFHSSYSWRRDFQSDQKQEEKRK